ncbi:hypothetical protein [Acinetobacter indicus]|uniref:hypothetical protein n=1 Tax=Acinetobacter indicus TaxID=756892 RepID=UPI001443D9E4|nr:hypothetical protein [Acinetobacter indicus]
MDLGTAASNLIEISRDIPKITFGTFDPVEINTMVYVEDACDELIDLPNYAVSSQETLDDEGWTLVTRRRNRGKTSKVPGRVHVRTKVSKAPRIKIDLKDDTDEEDVFEPKLLEEPSQNSLWNFFPKHFQELATQPGGCHHIDTEKELPQSPDSKIECHESSTVLSVEEAKEPIPSLITFSDEDLLLGHKSHNRPLFVSGYTRGIKINRILIDPGSSVNIMPLKTLKEIGLGVDDLLNSRLMIQ